MGHRCSPRHCPQLSPYCWPHLLPQRPNPRRLLLLPNQWPQLLRPKHLRIQVLRPRLPHGPSRRRAPTRSRSRQSSGRSTSRSETRRRPHPPLHSPPNPQPQRQTLLLQPKRLHLCALRLASMEALFPRRRRLRLLFLKTAPLALSRHIPLVVLLHSLRRAVQLRLRPPRGRRAARLCFGSTNISHEHSSNWSGYRASAAPRRSSTTGSNTGLEFTGRALIGLKDPNLAVINQTFHVVIMILVTYMYCTSLLYSLYIVMKITI